MTETAPLPSPRSEIRIIRTLFERLREDLCTDVLALRPLPPIRADHALLRRSPRLVHRYVRWLPHAGIGAAALALALLVYAESNTYTFLGHALHALLVVVPLLLVLFRPLTAWWLSLTAFLVIALSDFSYLGPWTPSGMVSHLLVMLMVAVRSRPRVAGELWLVTAAASMVAPGTTGETGINIAAMLVPSAAALSAVALGQGWRDSRREVVEQVAVTAQERSRRTLLEERTTIARELHDVVAHHMSVVAIQAEAAPYRVTDPPPELTRAFATIRENAVAALTELRRILGVVRAEDYEAPDAPQPTLGELDALLANVRDTGLEVEKTVTGAVRRLPPGVELSAYRIVQEALSNTIRHAPGAAARVEVSYVLGGLGLRIVNGAARGAVPPSPGAGHGIAGMRERVAMLDGRMTAGPLADGGYETVVFLPAEDGEPA